MHTQPFVNMAHPLMRNRWARFVEWLLPWFDPIIERKRNERTETIRLRSIRTRIRAEDALEQYRLADKRR